MINPEIALMVVDARRRDLEREARANALVRAARAAAGQRSTGVPASPRISRLLLRAQ
jgi:hypothetical protein